MSRDEALQVLGLTEGASEERIRAAHRQLIKKLHPDQGGSSLLAQQVNEAKHVLLGR
jgi:curved DNA-binding protein CbpA